MITGDYFCSGFIINENWIGTAASCTVERSANEIVAMTGTTLLSSGGTPHLISEIITHESFVAALSLNDVSLLRTQASISFTSTVAPIALASAYVQGGAEVTAAGWGKTFHQNEDFSEELRFIRLQTITNADCRSRLEAGNRRQDIFDSSLCTFNAIGQGSKKTRKVLKTTI